MSELVCSADDPRWLDERRRGVTATDIVAIIGLSAHQSAYSLYYEKTGAIEAKPDNDRWRLGRELEPIIASRWAEQSSGYFLSTGAVLYRSTSRAWQMATTDRMAVPVAEVNHCTCGTDLQAGFGHEPHCGIEETGPSEPVELKSWADADRHAWDTTPPPGVRAQVLWQMDTLDVPRGHVGVLFLPSGEFRSYVIEHQHIGHRDEATGLMSGIGNLVCEACKDIDLMRTAARDFLDRIDLKDPPSADGSSATLAALKARFLPKEGPAADIDPAAWDGMVAYRKLSRDYKAAAREFEALIREQLGESTRLKVGGIIVGKRITGQSKVKEHVRTNDYIRVLGGDDDD